MLERPLPPSLLAKDDPRLAQIVGRKLHRNFVARNNSNEVLSHFAGDVGEHVALTCKINPKHCAWENLSHRSFHHDLFFLRHGAEIYHSITRSLNCSGDL